jgi:hypothetical protein
MAVDRVDVLAQPDAGVGDPQPRRPEPGGDRGAGAAGPRVVVLLEAELGRAGQREPVEQRLGQAVVVVAGDDRHLAFAQCLAELFEEGARGVERGAEGEVAQLDDVPEQDDAIGAGDLLEQQPPNLCLAQDVLAAGHAEVEVGEDCRPHPHLLPFGWAAKWEVRLSGCTLSATN